VIPLANHGSKNSAEKTGGWKNKPLNPRQQKFVKTLAKRASLTDAAIEAGFSSRYPSQSGFQALQQVRGRVPHLLEKHGLGEEILMEIFKATACYASGPGCMSHGEKGTKKT
jgi:hypothetical protein